MLSMSNQRCLPRREGPRVRRALIAVRHSSWAMICRVLVFARVSPSLKGGGDAHAKQLARGWAGSMKTKPRPEEGALWDESV